MGRVFGNLPLAVAATTLTGLAVLPGLYQALCAHEWRALLMQDYEHPVAVPYEEVPTTAALLVLACVLVVGAVLPGSSRLGATERDRRMRWLEAVIVAGILAALALGAAYVAAEADGHRRLRACHELWMDDLHGEAFDGPRYTLEQARRWDRYAPALLAASMAATGWAALGLAVFLREGRSARLAHKESANRAAAAPRDWPQALD